VLLRRWTVVDAERAGVRHVLHSRETSSTHPGTPALVLVPGSGTTSRYFRPLLQVLDEAGAPAAAVELPGIGASSGAEVPRTVAGLADVLADWLRTTGRGPTTLVGNSMGTQIVTDTAMRHPELVEGLVLIGPTVDHDGRNRFEQAGKLLVDATRERPSLLAVAATDPLFTSRRGAPAIRWCPGTGASTSSGSPARPASSRSPARRTRPTTGRRNGSPDSSWPTANGQRRRAVPRSVAPPTGPSRREPDVAGLARAALTATLAGAGAGVALARRRDLASPLRHGPATVPSPPATVPRFPAGFRFGAATAAHQVEGGLRDSNWTRWEEHVRADGRPGILSGDRAGRASAHWERFDDDVHLMVDLGLDTYRFSPEWSRLEPSPGRFDDDALDRYRSWCHTLRAAGITPMVTLHHFTEPGWVTDRGGFEDVSTPAAFERFVAHVVPALADQVDLWITINEPNVFAVLGWLRGEFPPGATDLGRTARVLRNVLEAHGRAYHAIHRLDRVAADPAGPPAAVSIAHNVVLFEPRTRANPLEVLGARVAHRNYNVAPVEACRSGRVTFGLPGAGVNERLPGLAGTLDWLGVNHYFRYLVQVPGRGEPVGLGFDDVSVKNDMGWDLLPGTLATAVRWAASYGLPVTVTEHGTCDGEVPDDRRRWFVPAALQDLASAVAEGVDCRGYVHWSLLDNFEWAHGFEPRFGLYRVDYATQERALTGGGAAYRDVVTASREDRPRGAGRDQRRTRQGAWGLHTVSPARARANRWC
jgi:beta-glucosidase